MTLGNTPRRETAFAVESGKSYAFGISFRDRSADAPVDLTGATVRMAVADSTGGVVLEKAATLTVPTQGLCQFQFQAEELDLPPGEYVHDITIVSPNGYSTPLLKGSFDIGSNADTDSGNRYTAVDAGADVAFDVIGADYVQVTVDSVDGMHHALHAMIDGIRAEAAAAAARAEAAAASATAAASSAAADAAEIRDMLNSTGHPFWRALTQAEYDSLGSVVNGILYIIIDPEAQS